MNAGGKLLRKILSSADSILGLLLALAVAILGIIGLVKNSIISAAILAILALLLSFFLRLRPTIDEIKHDGRHQAELWARVLRHLDGNTQVYYVDYPDLTDPIETANDILVIAGASLRTTVGSYFRHFRRGTRIRLLCPNPADKKLMNQLAMATRERTPEKISIGIGSNLDLARSFVPLSSNNNVGIRLASHLSPTGVICFKRSGSTNEGYDCIYVKLFTFRHNTGAGPVFQLQAVRDEPLFEIFHESAGKYMGCRLAGKIDSFTMTQNSSGIASLF